MSKNGNLHSAKANKNDEFYTQLSDIEKELNHYKKHFENKVVYCNCDDCYESNFVKYFILNFNELKLKKLIATCYGESKVCGSEMKVDLWGTNTDSDNKIAYKIEITEMKDFNNDGAIGLDDVEYLLKTNPKKIITKLNEDGDFRSDECIELLKESDIVVTNPPFSLFRDFIATLIEYGKKFLVIANSNAITYKEFFPLLKDNKVWLGNNYVKEFKKPDGTIQKFGNICWFTNLAHKKRNEELILVKNYNEKDYPKYDNYNAINVDKVVNIPYDYDGVMGVPITFLDKYNPEQFEIIGLLNSSDEKLAGLKAIRTYENYKEVRPNKTFTGSSGRKTNGNPILKGKPLKGNYYLNDDGDFIYSTYARILIKRIK